MEKPTLSHSIINTTSLKRRKDLHVPQGRTFNFEFAEANAELIVMLNHCLTSEKISELRWIVSS